MALTKKKITAEMLESYLRVNMLYWLTSPYGHIQKNHHYNGTDADLRKRLEDDWKLQLASTILVTRGCDKAFANQLVDAMKKDSKRFGDLLRYANNDHIIRSFTFVIPLSEIDPEVAIPAALARIRTEEKRGQLLFAREEFVYADEDMDQINLSFGKAYTDPEKMFTLFNIFPDKGGRKENDSKEEDSGNA